MKEVAVMATEKSAKELAYKTGERLTGKTKEFIEKTVIKPLEEWLSLNRSLAVATEGGGRVQAQYMMRDTAKNAVKREVAGEAVEKTGKEVAEGVAENAVKKEVAEETTEKLAKDAVEKTTDDIAKTAIEINKRSNDIKDIDKLNKEIEIIDSKGKCLGEFDEIDISNKIFYEDKTAKGLNIINPRTGKPSQTPQEFADKQIYTKTKNRINNLLNSTGTRQAKTNIIDNVPDIKELQEIKTFVFRLDGDSTELRKAVQKSIQKLKLEFPDYTFEAVFGNH